MPSPIIIEGGGFSQDILAFLRLLAVHRVRYLIVGGEAVIYHGYPRVTGDVDFFYDNTEKNAGRLYRALLEFWHGRIPGVGSPNELREKGMIFQFGRPPHRIDLMNRIDGVRFERAWPSRLRVRLKTKKGVIPAFYIALPLLLKNKRATGRPKDLDDARFLAAQSSAKRTRRG